MTGLKLIAGGIGSLLLLPILVIGGVAGGVGDGDQPSAPPVMTGDLEAAVLSHPNIGLTAAARGDVEAGLIDSRVLQVLLVVAEAHELAPVGPFISGHTYFVKGTSRVSNHMYGRAVDIIGVDGAPVSPSNVAARNVMELILDLPVEITPDEVGGPWVLSNGRITTFTKDHLDHIHVGVEQ